MCLEGVFKFARHRVLSATRAVTYHLSQLPPRVWYSNNQRLKHFGSDQNMQRLIAKIDVWRSFEAIVSHKRAGGRHKRAREVGLFSQSNRFPLHQFNVASAGNLLQAGPCIHRTTCFFTDSPHTPLIGGILNHLSSRNPRILLHNRRGFDGKSILGLVGSEPKKNGLIRHAQRHKRSPSS